MKSYVSQTSTELLLKPGTEPNTRSYVTQTTTELLLKPGTEPNTRSYVTQTTTELLYKPETNCNVLIGQSTTEVLSRPNTDSIDVFINQMAVEVLIKMPPKYSTEGSFFLMFSPNTGFFQNIFTR
jgi:hypothetical protein